MKNKPLGKHIRKTFMVFAVVPMALAVITCLVAIGGSYKNTIRRDTELGILNIGQDIRDLLDSTTDIIETLASDPDIISAITNQRTLNAKSSEILAAMLLGREEVIMQIHILSRNGVFRYSTGSIPNLFTLPVLGNYGIFFQLNQGNTVIRATKYYSYTDKQIALNIGTPVFSASKEIVGYIVADIRHSALDSVMRNIHGGYVHDIVLADDRNVVACDIGQRERDGLTIGSDWDYGMRPSGGKCWLDSNIYVWNYENLNLYVKVNDNYIRPLMIVLMIGLGFMVLIALAVAYFAGNLLSNRVSRQFGALWNVMRRAPETGFTEKFIPRETDFEEVVQLGQFYNESNERTRNLITSIEEKQKRLATVELNALKAQLRPHFLYNVLNDIKSMAKLGRNEEIVQMVVCFAQLLRSSMSTEDEFHTLSEEIDLIRKYITMQNLRGLRPINLKIEVPESLEDMQIPRLMLQPLVENATIHGLSGETMPVILVRVRNMETGIEFIVADNGCGINEENRTKLMNEGAVHEGIGINNIQQRLRLYYGDQGLLEIVSKVDFYTVIRITVPSEAEC